MESQSHGWSKVHRRLCCEILLKHLNSVDHPSDRPRCASSIVSTWQQYTLLCEHCNLLASGGSRRGVCQARESSLCAPRNALLFSDSFPAPLCQARVCLCSDEPCLPLFLPNERRDSGPCIKGPASPPFRHQVHGTSQVIPAFRSDGELSYIYSHVAVVLKVITSSSSRIAQPFPLPVELPYPLLGDSQMNTSVIEQLRALLKKPFGKKKRSKLKEGKNKIHHLPSESVGYPLSNLSFTSPHSPSALTPYSSTSSLDLPHDILPLKVSAWYIRMRKSPSY